ncbi:MAG: hypothetical protein LUD72_04665 [Bacteroidales bacterium]|nr:hypothetical protein [Bacteroidales bacterium]
MGTEATDVREEEEELEEFDEDVEDSFDVKLAKLEETVTRQSLHREIMYQALVFCQERHLLREVEDTIAALPEFKHAVQSQYHIIQALCKGGGLVRFYLGEDGEVLDDAYLETLSEDEQDDLIYDEVYETTDVGKAFVEQHAPHSRLEELFEQEPKRKDTYLELLELCDKGPQTYKTIEELLKGRDVLIRETNCSTEMVQPSVFVDKLQRAAGLVWDDGWKTTDEGRDVLRECQAEGV